MSGKLSLSELKREWKKDCDIDQQRLEEETFRTFDLHAKWHDLWISTQDEVRVATDELQSIKRLLYEYYRRMPLDPKTLKTLGKEEPWDYESDYREIQHLVSTDPAVIILNSQLELAKLKVKQTEECLDFVSKRSYYINAINECRRLSRGLT